SRRAPDGRRGVGLRPTTGPRLSRRGTLMMRRQLGQGGCFPPRAARALIGSSPLRAAGAAGATALGAPPAGRSPPAAAGEGLHVRRGRHGRGHGQELVARRAARPLAGQLILDDEGFVAGGVGTLELDAHVMKYKGRRTKDEGRRTNGRSSFCPLSFVLFT